MDYQHIIPVYLYENHLSDEGGDFYARIESNRTLDIAALCQSAIERTAFPADLSAMIAYVTKFFEEAQYRLGDGYAISTPLFNAALHVKGVFDSPSDHFDRARHGIKAEFLQSVALGRYLYDNVALDIKGRADSGAVIEQVLDSATGGVDSGITCGGVLVITGGKIKVAGDDASVGVYFTQVSDGAEHHFTAAQLVENTPKKLILLLPAQWGAGYQMRLSIKTQYTTSNKHYLKEPRTIVFDKILTTSAAQ